jgi:hypothetical protein
MHAETLSVLDDYYSNLFGIDRASLWHGTTLRTHTGRLQGYEGYYVAWRGDGVHVSVPPSDAGGSTGMDELSVPAVQTLQNLDFWGAFATTRGLRVVGPSTHAYLDRDPGPVEGVTRLQDDDLRSLREAVDEADWVESGWNDQPPHAFGLRENGSLVAAANLNLFQHQPRDIGVVVPRRARGQGHSQLVGRHAASFAIRTHGFARWSARDSNAASIASSRRLGFERWCTQLAVR